MSRAPRESDRECDLCHVRLRWRRPMGWMLGLLVAWIVLVVAVSAAEIELLPAARSPAALAFPIVLLGGIALFLALGGPGLLLRRWEICPRCADFRLPDDRYRRLVRIERIFGALRFYLGVPAGFFFLVSMLGRGDVKLAAALALGTLNAQILSSVRPQRRGREHESGWTRPKGDRIPEDDRPAG